MVATVAHSGTQIPVHKSIIIMAKLDGCEFDSLPRRPYFPDLTSNSYYPLTIRKRMLWGKRFCTNDEIIVETEAFLEGSDKSLYQKDSFTKRWTIRETSHWLCKSRTTFVNGVEFWSKSVSSYLGQRLSRKLLHVYTLTNASTLKRLQSCVRLQSECIPCFESLVGMNCEIT